MTMLRRVLALVLTVATMSAPLALALCHVDCADATSSREQAAHHSCHDTNETAAVSITGIPHMCGHEDGAPAGVERAPTVAAPVAVVPLVAWAAPPPVFERVIAVEIQHSPPGSFQLVSQLRV